MKSGYRLFLLPALLFALISCQPKTKNLKIIVTTDVHGSFFPIDINTGREIPVSLSRVQSLINEEKQNTDQDIILLDNGDIIQGDPVVYYSSFEKTDEPHICARVLNFMQYDAATMGNHDIEAGHPVYDKLVSESNFPWLAANAIRTDNGKPYFEPYSIINKGGVKVAVLGLITPAIPTWLPPDIWSGMEFTDMIKSASLWIDKIKKDENPDVIIGLFHAGMDYTYNSQSADTPKNENAAKLVAEQVAGFDIIFCGHDHKTWNKIVQGPNGEDVLILGSRSKAREVAIADISLTRKGRNWEFENIMGSNKEVADYQPDPMFMEEFATAQHEVKEYVKRVLGTFSKPISTREAFFGSSAFVDLIHQVQLDISGADISFAAPLSYDIEIPSGEITVGDLFKLYRYENLLYTMEMSGREILDYLNYSYKGWFAHMNSTTDHLIKLNENSNGRLGLAKQYYHFDSGMGINYQVDVSRPEGQMVSINSMAKGQAFDLQKKYLVALNSYRGNGGGGHLVDGAGIPHEELAGRIVKSSEKDLRFYMMKWIEEKKVVDPKPSNQWIVIPQNLVEAGIKRDYPILFRN
jgi:2',3'-cyclic-nucleotide 2'-phosphodiesterase/3'-nucleotidase